MLRSVRSTPAFATLVLAALLLVTALAPVVLRGQTTSTEILGRVVDASGAVIPGAAVTIRRVATGETRAITTNQAGEYSFPLIEVGVYTVQCVGEIRSLRTDMRVLRLALKLHF